MSTRRTALSATVANILVAAMVLLVGAAGCDVVNDVADAINIPIEFDHTANFQVDLGKTTGRAAGLPAPADAQYPVDVGALPVDLISQSSDLAANREKIRRIEFTKIDVTPKSNSLTAASPPMSLYVAAKGATTSDQGVLVATIPPIPAGSTAPVSAVIDAAGMDAAQAHILTFDFTIIPNGTLSVKQGETVPGGALDMGLTIGIKAILNPTK